MVADYSSIDPHAFVDDRLAENGFRIQLVTEALMLERLDDFMQFVNTIRREYSDLYGWQEESQNYFLNALVDKWKYSFAIINEQDELCFVSFASVYGEVIHYHFAYARSGVRGMSLSKLHMLKLSQTCIDEGFEELEAFWPKTNSGSIILHLRMGWEIQSIRNDTELFMTANAETVRRRTLELLAQRP
jgi:hypothetical protein